MSHKNKLPGKIVASKDNSIVKINNKLVLKKYSSESSSNTDTETSADSNNSSSVSLDSSTSISESVNESITDISSIESSSSDYSEEIITDKKIVKKKQPKKSINNDDIFKELIKKQLKNVPPVWKLKISDMKRICKYIDTSIFHDSDCCMWKGYITNMNNQNKGTYVNFYFKNKKVALHRLLYSNFVAPLDSSEYLKFNCNNKGVCCNVNHYEKYKYSKVNNIVKKDTKVKPKKQTKEFTIVCADNNDRLILDFD